MAGLDDETLPPPLSEFDCRNNRLAQLTARQDGFDDAVAQAQRRFGGARVGVFVGTSTSGLLQSELAYQHREAGTGALPDDFRYGSTHNTYSLARFLRTRWGLSGPAWVQSSACASGAKAFGTAARAIAAGLVDAAVVGGVDTLCLTTLYGFGSLELLAPDPCRPFDAERNGISIGEAGAFVLLQRPQPGLPDMLQLIGFGESSDAYHMSSPHPQGVGAHQAMQHALAAAGLPPESIGYVNLHGTATPSNDAAEDAAVFALFGDSVPVSSTKGAHGHALGAAGALEAVVCLLALRNQQIPGGVNTSRIDPALRSAYLLENRIAPLRAVMSNSFGFGGSNCTLIFGAAR
ncbi:MAG TPA: beta-ketoacyl-ACP synthase [Burkholderiaceae bacterium]|nr:beta-ketoacyl-ACP synthase [Burkholderiaceae bacterium]